MKIVLEELQHQSQAIEQINEAFPNIDQTKIDYKYYANPLIEHAYNPNYFIDIKMETGTGKTYVYTRMMYELHKRGIFKFIIVVPSPSIKEGTKNFIESDYAKQHFSQFYENTYMNLNTINAGDFTFKQGKHHTFPSQFCDFVEASNANTNQIEVLLINSGMLTSKSMNRDDYDQTLINGETCPLKALEAVRPVVIIDEPHRFSEGTQAYKKILEMKPQSIIRFGATFPLKKEGRGKNAREVPQYYRKKPQYTLNAVESFNQGLVKGVDIIYPSISEEQLQNTYIVQSTSKDELILKRKDRREYIVKVGESLSKVDNDFEGDITYVNGKAKSGNLSNDLEIASGMKLIPGTFKESYQERIISQAIDQHFEIEKRNFFRENGVPKIKTLSLFFIDSVDSYGRKKTNGSGRERGWLVNVFEKILTEKLNNEIRRFSRAINRREIEYCDFLKATLRSLQSEHQEVHAGYFSDDRGTKDDDIVAEVDDILKNKEKMLSFKDENGNWITRRFFFSKWTLREGWDNPNVFVIAKLRTSGSENSKIQEVGRGLRLPVDENGQRVHQEEFESRLSFLIGYDERDFAEKLINQVNSDIDFVFNEQKLDDKMIQLIVKDRQQKDESFNEDKLRNELGEQHIIDYSGNFIDKVSINGETISGFEALTELYPVLKQRQVMESKIRDMQKHPQASKVKLNKKNWNQLKGVWKKLVRRSMIAFDKDQESEIEVIIKATFTDENHYVLQPIEVLTESIVLDDNEMTKKVSKNAIDNQYETMNYGIFLKEISKKTSLQPQQVHKYIVEGMKKKANDNRYINEKTMDNLIKDFNSRFNQRFKSHYQYIPLEFNAKTSVYDYVKDEFVDEVSPNALGVNSSNIIKEDKKYLYEQPPLYYDSEHPELDVLERNYDHQNVVVYGKLPKQAIKIPRYDRGFTTPDFIFKVEDNNQEPKYLIVEAKSDNLRDSDRQAVEIQNNYFKHLKEKNIYYKKIINENEVWNELQKLGNEE